MKKLLLASLMTLCAAGAFANTAASIVPDPGNTFNNGSGYSLGFDFTVGSQAITVTALGYFNYTGLGENHDIGIYDMSGNLLMSGTVLAGSGAVNLFSYTGASGNTGLAANTSYQIMGTSGFSDPYSFNALSLTTDPDITYNHDEYSFGNTLAFGTQSDALNGYFGPNFQFTPSGSPEPFTMGLGVAGIGLFLRRRMKSRA